MKTVIIGLDGATFDIVDPLARAGRLPVLSRLMREGSHAPLRSTILPNSFPGWASCITGTSEGMHGVFSPFIKKSGQYGVTAMSGRDIMTRPLWQILTEHRARSIVLNVPTSYPPEEINGLLVTGMLTPSLESGFTYPEDLRDGLLRAVPDYQIEPERIPDRRARAEEFRRTIAVREKALKFLVDQGEWDFLMVVFSVLDRAQHDYWADKEPTHPRHDPNSPDEFRNFIHEIYERLDAAAGRLIEMVPSACRVIVCSDHGFCSELYEIRVNEVLANAGLLSFKSPATRKTRSRLRELKGKLSRRLLGQSINGNVLDKKVQYGSAFLGEIDWSRTRAFFAQDKGVWLNLKGREQSGIVQERAFDSVIKEVQDVLQRLRSPIDGLPVFERVMTRDQAFHGRWSSRLPDVVMVPRSDQYVYNERPGYGEEVVAADSTTGTHARDGIFIAWGNGIAQGATFETPPNLRDVGPTALASLECALTQDMDGRALIEVFEQPLQPARTGSSYRGVAEAADSVYDKQEESAIRERLRALGYIRE